MRARRHYHACRDAADAALRFVDIGWSNCYPDACMKRTGSATAAVTGAAGMLGQDVCRYAPTWAAVAGLTRADADLSVAEQARTALEAVRADVIIHCAAYTDVDGATCDPNAAWRGNVLATRNVAAVAAQLGARLVYISTDYVFDGASDSPYTESDEPSPINAYGESKLLGEREAAAVEDSVIVRTQWLYGPGGRNFIRSILSAARGGKSLRVVDDERGHPSYTPDLAHGIWRLIETDATGIVHMTNTGVCSRLELAQTALEYAGLDGSQISGIASADWVSPTRRPLNAVLESERTGELGISPLRHWRDAVREYVALLCHEWDGGDAPGGSGAGESMA